MAVGVKKNRRGRVANLNGNSLQLLSEGMKTHCPKQATEEAEVSLEGQRGVGLGPLEQLKQGVRLRDTSEPPFERRLGHSSWPWSDG